MSEHVVPKRVLKGLLLSGDHKISDVLQLNLCAVLTRAEDRMLLASKHLDPLDPWSRYAGTGIMFIDNPDWNDDEHARLDAHRLLAPTPLVTCPA